MDMQILFIIRLDFDDGNWGYVETTSDRRFMLTPSPDEARKFYTKQEAADFYYDVIGSHAKVNGASIKKVFITTINY